MKAFIDKYFDKLIVALCVLVLVVYGGVTLLREHDARILAEQTVKESAVRVSTLEQAIKDKDTETAAKLLALQKLKASVTTPAQAIAEIPKMTDIPLTTRVLPDAPSEVAVQAVPLFQDLAQCKADKISLDACTAKLGLQGNIVTEEKGQVTALQSKGGTFWQRLSHGAKVIGCAAGGAAIGGLSKQPGGAAIGGGAGAALCSLF